MPPIQIKPTKLCDKLDDPPPKGKDPFKVGTMTPTIPKAIVDGHAYGRVCQIPAFDPNHFTDDDAAASVNVDVNQDFVIDVYWDLSGPLISAFCGTWVVTIFFDCVSNASLDFSIFSDEIPFGCPDPKCVPPTTNSTRQYHASFLVPAGTVPLDPNTPTPGTFDELDVSIVLLSQCLDPTTGKKVPTGVIGSIPLEEVLFF